jgi:hypothetical protein
MLAVAGAFKILMRTRRQAFQSASSDMLIVRLVNLGCPCCIIADLSGKQMAGDFPKPLLRTHNRRKAACFTIFHSRSLTG